jgi:hypothetical protein
METSLWAELQKTCRTVIGFPLSAECLFQIFVLKSGSHPVDLVLGDTMPSGLIAPLRDGFADLFGYFAGSCSVQLKNESPGPGG